MPRNGNKALISISYFLISNSSPASNLFEAPGYFSWRPKGWVRKATAIEFMTLDFYFRYFEEEFKTYFRGLMRKYTTLLQDGVLGRLELYGFIRSSHYGVTAPIVYLFKGEEDTAILD